MLPPTLAFDGFVILGPQARWWILTIAWKGSSSVSDISFIVTILLRVLEEFTNLEGDILGLQEVQNNVYPLLCKALEEGGFAGVYKKKTNERVDGVAIFYSTAKYKLSRL